MHGCFCDNAHVSIRECNKTYWYVAGPRTHSMQLCCWLHLCLCVHTFPTSGANTGHRVNIKVLTITCTPETDTNRSYTFRIVASRLSRRKSFQNAACLKTLKRASIVNSLFARVSKRTALVILVIIHLSVNYQKTPAYLYLFIRHDTLIATQHAAPTKAL